MVSEPNYLPMNRSSHPEVFFKTGVLRNFAKFTWNIFKNYESCLEATQLENKIKPLEKNEISVDSLKKDHKEFIKNKLILKTQ